MNRRFSPDEAETAGPAAATKSRSAMITPSYGLDFERCRLLCETADRHVTGMDHHYILVEGRDVPVFRQLESARRTVVDERDLLPGWLKAFDDPLSGFRRRIWLSLKTMPLRGWHVQQLRRIGIAAHVQEDVLVYCDSDVAFLRPFDFSVFRKDGRTRLFRRDHALREEGLDGHVQQRIWATNAGKLLGLPPSSDVGHDYITTLIAWNRRTVVDMCRHIEAVNHRHWVSAIGSARKFSECLIYGRYVDDVIHGEGHFHDAREFCNVLWYGKPMSDDEFHAFVADMSTEQVAICMQSFIGTDVARIRRLLST
ncbi:DUF6492 family protein [Mesorhizobium sp. LHD-90]|uniref:DUF6492 family protein n=1 Tax=Mesorhizobium sp. LHD-90 TaxID=3071414 RepID=UPI0027E1C8CF|nr:DUF6492 family protein [Mesorhizobium sp. LHD-90]MDQ6436664.1 DUF6492 family protein [Mesorhizobium sp. LHD-90]